MDQTSNNAESNNTAPQPAPTSLNQTLASLFGPTAPKLAQQTSTQIRQMAIYSCHISFLKCCRDHSFIPKGLRLNNPLKSQRSSDILSKASNLLLTERLSFYRQKYATAKRLYGNADRQLFLILDEQYYGKILQLNDQKSCYTHKKQLHTHSQKFDKLLLDYKAPFLSPYKQLTDFNISTPTFHGPLQKTTHSIPPDDNTKTVINLSGQPLTQSETDVLALGLKFAPKPTHDPTADLASRIHGVTKKLGEGMEASVTHEVCSLLKSYDLKRDRTPDNLTPSQRTALKSLKKKTSNLRFLPADKGNATVVLTNEQYINKVNTHLSITAYSKIGFNPTSSLTTKLDNILRKLHKDKEIDKQTQQSMRVLHPRYPQLYGQPKIHKPDAPIRPIVSFYNTPLSALHKVLAHYLKPLAQNPLRLKDSTDFKNHLHSTTTPSYTYHASLDVKALYTSCDMRAATKTATATFEQKPDLLPSNMTAKTIGILITFCLDNSYFEFDGDFYKQNTGGTMGSPLIVELSEIRTAETEQHALATCTDPPNTYRHFVDDGIGDFRDKQHADKFLAHINSFNPDLQYTIEHPAPDGTLPFLDVLIHPNKSTSVYRKPTHTNLYTKYNSCASNSTKDSVIRSLTRRAYNICSKQHLETELQTVWDVCLKNGFPPHRVEYVMNNVRVQFANKVKPSRSLTLSKFTRQLKSDSYSLHVNLPYHHSLSKPLKQTLQKHDIKVTNSSPASLRNILTKTKTKPPGHLTPNVIYEIPCNDCTAKYDGQTKRPIIKRITEHERCYRLENATDESTGNIKSAPALHALITGHTIGWNNTTILTTTKNCEQLDLTEHAAIQIRRPTLNRTDKAPNVHSLWTPLLRKIAKSFKPRPSDITNFPPEDQS